MAVLRVTRGLGVLPQENRRPGFCSGQWAFGFCILPPPEALVPRGKGWVPLSFPVDLWEWAEPHSVLHF